MQSGPCTEYLAPAPGRPSEIVELAAAARHGDSGGPILNSQGELAGVLFGEGGGHTDGSYGGRVQKFLELTALDLRTLPASNSNSSGPTTAVAANAPRISLPASNSTPAAAARFDGGIYASQGQNNQADWNAWQAARLADRSNGPTGSMQSTKPAERPLTLAADPGSNSGGTESVGQPKSPRFIWQNELKSFLAAFGVAAMLLHLLRWMAG
jgi:hypothetical protein